MKKIIAAAVALAAVSYGIGVTNASTTIRPASDLDWVTAESGDNYFKIVRDQGLTCTGTELFAANGRAPLDPGTIVLIPPSCRTPGSTTTTTVQPSTTVASTTTSTTSTTTTTSTTVAPTTTPAPVNGFVETFDNDTGLDRFRTGVWHRDNVVIAQTEWEGDHDLDCGSPATTRTIHRDAPSEAFYVCRDHWMTSVGDTSGYSIGWFTPDRTFSGQRTVSWDVTSTDLGTRQWWEVAIVPADFDSGVAACPYCSAISWLADGPASPLPAYSAAETVVGSGPFGADGPLLNGSSLTFEKICGSFALDPEGCGSKMIRRQWTLVDNANGTVTVTFMGRSWTRPGSFPDEFRVVFKSHRYTPLKSATSEGRPVIGHTDHFDNVSVT